MRVLILYNEPVLPRDHPDAESEYDILDTVAAVEGHLARAGHQVARLGVQRDPAVLIDGLRAHRPDVAFNLFEGLADHYETEGYLAGILEWLGVPYTGSPPAAMALARNKHHAKLLMRGAGLPTPDFLVVERLPVPVNPLGWPVIVKPARQDASVGLDQGSVVTDAGQLEHRVGQLLERYGSPVLVEQFIRGREFNVGLIENPDLQVLPLAEIEFLIQEPGYWPIVTYDAKWKPGTPECDLTPPRFPTDVSPALAERLRAVAREAFRLFGCRDYARADFRVSPAGEPYLLEVNANPDFGPGAGLANALKAAGLSHAQFTAALVENALTRRRVLHLAANLPGRG
jgi:D-alanine-D-alanine ligase